MPYLIFPDKWLEPPSYAAQIDWSHPIARGLISAPLLSMRDAFHDPALTSGIWTNSGLTFTDKDSYIAATGSANSHADITIPIIDYPFSGAALFNLNNAVSQHILLGFGSTGASYALLTMRGDAGSDPIRLTRSDGTTETTTSIFSEFTEKSWHFASTSIVAINSASVNINRKRATATSTSDVQPTTFTHARLGGRYNSTLTRFNGFIPFWAIWNREFFYHEHLALSENPWQIYRRDLGTVYFIPQPANIVTLGKGSISITGHAPVILQPNTITLGKGSIAFTGYAPTISQSADQTIQISTGHVSITGYAPTILQPNTISLEKGSVAVTGYAANLSQPNTVTLDKGSVSITGHALTVSQPNTVTLEKGTVAITGYAPIILQANTVTLGKGGIAVTGYAPTILQPNTITIGKGSVSITGYAPTILQELGQLVKLETGHISITGYPINVSQPNIVTLEKGNVSITGYAPEISQPQNIQLDAGHISTTGYALGVLQPQAVGLDTGHITYTGYALTVVAGKLLGTIFEKRIVPVTTKRRIRGILWPT